MRRASVLALSLSLSACSHSDPFPTGTRPADGPFSPVPPVRLTYNPGQDVEPAWLQDGSGFLYSFERPGVDRCLGLLPPDGGSRRAEKCFTTDVAGITSDVLGSPASGPGGRLAWVEAHGPAGQISPTAAAIRVGTLAETDTGVIVRSLPYLASSGEVHTTATHLNWLGPDTLLYVGAEVLYTSACGICKLDTLVTGRDVALLDLHDPAKTPLVVPGTTDASSAWPARDGTAIYYTLGGDSKVYRRMLRTGVVSLAADFDTLGIVRDASVGDSVIVAVVGGLVSFGTDSLFSRLQSDSGGFLVHLDLRSGTRVLLGNPEQLFRLPRLSPNGRSIVVQAFQRAQAQINDLWLLQSP